MAEAKDVVKIGIMVMAVVFFGALAAGFYFTVTNVANGQPTLMGGFEGVMSSFFRFVAAPFNGLTSAINSFFDNLHI